MTSKAFDNVLKLNGLAVNVKEYGAKGDGLTDDAAAINAAIAAVSAAGGGTVFIPKGEYGFVTTQLNPADNVTLLGEGRKSVLKFIVNTNTGTGAGSGIAIIRSNGSAPYSPTLTNFYVRSLTFDGSLGYPANSNTSPTQITVRQWGVLLTNIEFNNVAVTDCFFEQLSGGSVVLTSGTTGLPTNVRVERCTFFKGGYNQRPIYISGENGARIQGVVIRDNYTNINGPQYYYDAADANYVNSTDAIGIDNVDQFNIEQNTIIDTSGIGIRVEQSENGVVANNTILKPGQTGIAVYFDCAHVSVIGNSIEAWGRIPSAYSIRSFSGVYYYPTEDIITSPADPSVDSKFAVWPYTTSSINVSTIPAYAAGVAIEPFRGHAAIMVTQVSTLCSVVGNTCKGNLTQAGGKYVYASDFGVTPVHPINSGAQPNATNSYVAANVVENTRLYDYYFPTWWNPVALTGGPSGGKVAIQTTQDATKLIQSIDPAAYFVPGLEVQTGIKFPAAGGASADVNVLDDYEEGSFQATLTVAGGSVTMGTDRTVQYTKIGRLVTLAGRVQLSNAATPSGEVAIETLPYTSSSSGVAACYIFASNVGAITEIRGRIAPGATKMVLTRNNAGAAADIGANLTNTSVFEFSITYTAQV